MGELISFDNKINKFGTSKRMSIPAKVLSITSGKGGVGKTHTAVNLGYELVRKGKRVLLIDADLGLANINIMLGFKPGATIVELLNGSAKISDVIISHEAGFDILPAASGIPEIVNLTEDNRASLLAQIGSLGNNYDYVIVDTAAGIGDSVLYFNIAAEEIIVVIAPEPTSITDAYALIKVLSSQHGITEFSILVNRNPIGQDGRTTFTKLANATDRFLNVRLKYMGILSEDEAVSEAVKAQTPFCKLYPGAKVTRDMQRLVEKVLIEEKKRSAKGGLQFFFNELLENSQS